jgi:hypothetical protein
MSLNSFHKFFIAASFLSLGVVARWASGRNAALLVTPWLLWTSLGGMAVLAAYFAYRVKRA